MDRRMDRVITVVCVAVAVAFAMGWYSEGSCWERIPSHRIPTSNSTRIGTQPRCCLMTRRMRSERGQNRSALEEAFQRTAPSHRPGFATRAPLRFFQESGYSERQRLMTAAKKACWSMSLDYHTFAPFRKSAVS